jgi:trehalose 6-phosphate synthase
MEQAYSIRSLTGIRQRGEDGSRAPMSKLSRGVTSREKGVPLPCRPDGAAAIGRGLLEVANEHGSGGAMNTPKRPAAHPIWTARRLRQSLDTLFDGESIVVLANRQPFTHQRDGGGELVVKKSAGGLVTALEPFLQACSGVWVAHGSGSEDRSVVDSRDGLAVPSANPSYRLRRVWLTDQEKRGYYFGFANEGLWALCHETDVQPVFRPCDFDMYTAMNARFAEAVCDEASSESPLVLVQDYHFALAPYFIRAWRPESTIVSFWHVPWPAVQRFATCRWGRQLLEGLLGSSIVGFQTPLDCRNFIETVTRLLGARVDRSRDVITYKGHATLVRAYPVSIEWPHRQVAQSPPIAACREIVCRQIELAPNMQLGVGVDRLDYTKGIEEKFLAIERLLESHPELRGRFVFVQLAEPSRECLPAYRDLRGRVLRTAERVNARYGAGRYRPIVLVEDHHDPSTVFRFLRAADLCYVNSLHDGMNLVAKEFVCARDDNRGVLVLSRRAGAAQQLTGALMVNPHAIDDSASVLADALKRPAEDQAARMRAMRTVVARFNTYWWAAQILHDAAAVRRAPAVRQSRACIGATSFATP